jgi:catechol 2,3-dioxygenase-like lactoylglutathione lyase family enzyme
VIKTLSIVSIMVRDLDEALDFYVGKLGFVKIADIPMGEDARWVSVAPSAQQGGL